MITPHSYEYVKTFVENLGYILISNTYKNNSSDLFIKDKDGYIYITSFAKLSIKNINSDRGKFYKNNPYTIQNIKLWCKINNKSFEIISLKFRKATDNLTWKCLKCEKEFISSWNSIHSGVNCTHCTNHHRQVTTENCLATKNPILASEFHPILNGDLTPFDVTCSSGDYVWWKCSKNPKHEWQATINNRKKGKGCPYCSGRYASEEYNLLIVNPKLCEEWDYDKNDKKPEDYTPNTVKKVWWKCKECGHEWQAKISDRNHGNGCPQCHESKGEKKIKEYLKMNNIYFDIEYTFYDLIGIGGGLLRFDVPVFWDKEKTQLRMLIEYDGQQHFEWVKWLMNKENFLKLQKHDKLKNNYCKTNNIKLLRIPYWDFDNIEEILNKELNLSEDKLSLVSNY
jgi:DNA-directed RNA polymerase subunit RPC12/RpoP